ncbi:YbdK family carboxylate-amine ligase [Leucobacter sp. CSA1]|uniref:Putative glutamate--cysteine ligase 2 n=1 Tax=Leucobacter chromiisoli TaxID=2796471 RepID=A0A934Q703_9MICO|nr:YbdK family carboxylate-amine ligase [Leucobacter chromiisoli]MBK0418603.1 YbdK family carboxylate-amine ligase [Leucobacter chromiisoli]
MTSSIDSELRNFGVEEEYLILDAESGTPSNRAADLIRSMPALRERAEREYFASQLETATSICRSAEDAERELRYFRQCASEAAEEQGVIVAGTGVPPVGGERAGSVTPKRRYFELNATMRRASAHSYNTGLHVHVEVPSPDAGVDVLARMAPWSPILLAMTTNSPIWQGQVMGFAGWRHMLGRSWPLCGYPPEFASGEEYEERLSRLIASGTLLDHGSVTWTARLSNRFPTIELRIGDSQLWAEDSVAFAVLVRALVDRCLRDREAGLPRPRVLPEMLTGANWMASRDGLDEGILDVVGGEQLPAIEFVDLLVDAVGEELARFGDEQRVSDFVSRLRAHGSGARRQVRAFEHGGLAGLLDLYGSEFGAGDAAAS